MWQHKVEQKMLASEGKEHIQFTVIDGEPTEQTFLEVDFS
jgi:hypothetical protein